MTQGIFNNGSRLPTKKALKEQVAGVNRWLDHGGDPEAISHFRTQYAQTQDPESLMVDPYSLVIEATSMFGNEFDGSLAEAIRTSQHGPFYIVGPDPYNSRKWYAQLTYDPSKGRWTVK